MDSLKTILEWHSINESYNKDNFEVWNGERSKLRFGAMFGPLGVALARIFGNIKRYPRSNSPKWFDKNRSYNGGYNNKKKQKVQKIKRYNPNENLNNGPVLPERL